MLHLILADEDLLTTLGRVAALILVIYLFLFAVLFFVGSLLLLYSNAWLREKIVLVHQLRMVVQTIDTVLDSPSNETIPAALEPDNRLGQAIQALHKAQSLQVIEIAKNTQKQVENIEKRVEPVADRVAEGVIEFRARTVMAQGILKAFFLPGLQKQEPRGPLLLPAPLDGNVTTTTNGSTESSSLPDVPAKVVVTQVNPPVESVPSTGMRDPIQSESGGTERSNNASGH